MTGEHTSCAGRGEEGSACDAVKKEGSISSLASKLSTHLEARHTLHNRGHNVELLLCALVVVTLALETDADPLGGRLDTSGPDGLVEAGGEADVLDAHGLLRKGDNGLDGLGSLCEGVSRVREDTSDTDL
jgi:hypothetical protein